MIPDLDRAVEQFVAAVGPRRTHSDGTYTEGFTKYIVEALLAAGWTPPERSLTEQVAERVRDVLPGVDVHVYSPEGGS